MNRRSRRGMRWIMEDLRSRVPVLFIMDEGQGISVESVAPDAFAPDNQKAAETGQNRPATLPQRRSQGSESDERIEPVRRFRRIGRNQPCPCGSGKKFKACCRGFRQS